MQPVDAAVAVATAHGLDVSAPVMLRSTNNIVAWLAPSPVVAKVSDQRTNRLAYELAAGRWLATAGAPVAAPDPVLGTQVHEFHGFSITYWRHLDADDDSGTEQSLARTLHRFHERARGLGDQGGGPLPGFDQGSIDVRRRLEDPGFAAALSADERSLLCRSIEAADLGEGAQGRPRLVLHGSPHGYNVVWVGGEAFLVDLESVCAGPLEWDLAYLDHEVVAAYPRPVDPEFLAACRRVIAACTAAWCMEGIGRGSDMEWHARTHLGNLERGEG